MPKLYALALEQVKLLMQEVYKNWGSSPTPFGRLWDTPGGSALLYIPPNDIINDTLGIVIIYISPRTDHLNTSSIEDLMEVSRRLTEMVGYFESPTYQYRLEHVVPAVIYITKQLQLRLNGSRMGK